MIEPVQFASVRLDGRRRRRRGGAAPPQVPAPVQPAVRLTGRPPVSAQVPADDPPRGRSIPAPWSTARRSTSARPRWNADLVQARHDAAQVLARIDWSQRDIVIVVPGTGDRSLLPEQRAGIAQAWPRGGVAVAFVDYDTDWNLARSIPQGMETLRQVLAGIARRGGRHRVFLVGQSQGALIIGEAMREPAVRAMVARASILGHPWISRTEYRRGGDPKVWHHTNRDDPIAQPLSGPVHQAVEAISMLLTGDVLGALPALVTQGPFNISPALAAAGWAVLGRLGVPGWAERDPHLYVDEYADALAFLRDRGGAGSADVGADAVPHERARRAMVEAAEHRFPYRYVRD